MAEYAHYNGAKDWYIYYNMCSRCQPGPGGTYIIICVLSIGSFYDQLGDGVGWLIEFKDIARIQFYKTDIKSRF